MEAGDLPVVAPQDVRELRGRAGREPRPAAFPHEACGGDEASELGDVKSEAHDSGSDLLELHGARTSDS